MHENKIGVEGAKAMAEMLKCNKTLTELCIVIDKDIEKNNIGDDGAKALAATLEMNTKLTSLCMSIIKLYMETTLKIRELH